MTATLLISAIFGASVPDLIRILKTIREQGRDKLVISDLLASVTISIILAVLAVWLAEVTSAKQAVLVGAAAPAVLTSLIGAMAGPSDNQRGGSRTSKVAEHRRYLLDWWRT